MKKLAIVLVTLAAIGMTTSNVNAFFWGGDEKKIPVNGDYQRRIKSVLNYAEDKVGDYERKLEQATKKNNKADMKKYRTMVKRWKSEVKFIKGHWYFGKK